MRSQKYIGILIVLWVVNLFNGTGLNAVYHVTEWTKRIVILLFVIDICMKCVRTHALKVETRKFYIYGGFVAAFIAIPYVRGYGLAGIDYLWVFCLVYLLSELEIDDNTVFWTGLIYGILGFIILYLYCNGIALNGWNENSIAMVGMHSFLMLIVPFFKEHRLRNKIALLVVASAFSGLLTKTDSRSGMLFMFIGALFAIGVLPRKIVSKNYFRTLICLLIPFAIARVSVMISKLPIMTQLNLWSYQQFQKPVFNGRDTIWERGLQLLRANPWIGTGVIGNSWHNSAITCLVAVGILGFVFWILSFGEIASRARAYFDDYIVIGCFVSFIVLYVQQSVELGIISSSPSLIAYIILGLMLGRVRFLEARESDEIC